MFLINPPRRGRVKARKSRIRARRGSKARGMFRHNPAVGYSRAYGDRYDRMFGSSTRKRRKARSTTMAKRKSRRRSTRRRKSYTRVRARKGLFRVKGRGKRRRVRRVRVKSKAGRLMRRNPPLSINNIKSMVIEGSKDAVGVIAGQVGTRLINNLIPFSGGMAVNTAKGVASALASSYLIAMVSPRMGRMALAGGLSEVVRPLLAMVPGVGGFISGEDFLGIGAYTLGAYTDTGRLSAYESGDAPQMSGVDFLSADDSGY